MSEENSVCKQDKHEVKGSKALGGERHEYQRDF
jgi:hypothetical protein